MSGRARHTVPYSAQDIEKYLKGQLSASESHRLERAALDDPFLADALEGFGSHPGLPPASSLQQDLSDLRGRLAERVATSRRKPFFIRYPLSVAAILVLLLGTGFGFFYFIARQNAPITSMVRNERPASVGPKARASTATASNADTAAANSASTAAVASPPAATAASPSPRASTAAASPSRTAAAMLSPASASTAPRAPATASPRAAPTLSPAANADSAALALSYASRDSLHLPPVALANATARYLPDTQRAGRLQTVDKALLLPAGFAVVYQGVVTDQHNHPIPGAFVSLKSPTGIGTVTDAQGQFKFTLSPVDTASLMTVSSLGYEQQSLAINTLSTSQAQDNIIRLSPETASLDEVVVTGYGARRKETKVAAPSGNGENLDSLWTRAAPIIGRRAYLEYLDNKKDKLGLDPGIHGTETLSFIVNRKGSLTMFKIEQSISPAHDAGIIRLVTDGPAWRLLAGKPARASVTINF